MRLLHVTDTFLPKVGGAEIAIDQLVRAMGAAGETCAVLAQRQRGARGEVDVPYPLVRYANPRSSLWAGWWVGLHLPAAERAVGGAEVLVGHHAFPPGYACVSYGRRRGIPSIVYPRGGDIYEVSRFRRKRLAWGKLTWALTHASAVVCASSAMEAIVRQIIAAGPGGARAAGRRLVRIPNGVNLDELRADASTSPLAADARLAGPFVLGLGRAIRRKGFDLLIEAFGRLPRSDWKLVIAGDGRELPALRARAASLGERVVFTGLVGGADKRWLLQHCRFMAAPSREESFGNVALEAMACGRAVVASRASGFAEIVRDGENGRLVAVGDAAELGGALADYAASDLAAESAAARETAEAFAWPVVAARWAALAREVRASA